MLNSYTDKTLYIRISWKQISENGGQGTNVLLDQRFILRWSSPLK